MPKISFLISFSKFNGFSTAFFMSQKNLDQFLSLKEKLQPPKIKQHLASINSSLDPKLKRPKLTFQNADSISTSSDREVVHIHLEQKKESTMKEEPFMTSSKNPLLIKSH